VTTSTHHPLSLASELAGLVTCKDITTSKQYKPKDQKLILTDAFLHIINALVTKEKMASPLDHDPTLPQYWSEHPRDKALGQTATPSPPSSLVSLFTMKIPYI